ncbi:Rhs element Vgr protein (modular protein) [Hyella patelloides LEGE 07179]|uniref:Rhs element Vgr protein (Modular protein) n=1 Tax=Hyella patelloides LEGE 07179 TaxID=945734 RepID=A0A563VQY9_9CYAN|nr:VgrG-related protein [Hyella patelloides]VEP13687.1 Rhs element Vgr protein (modular protein) [Hyella patelloides LEGE 07179]
MKVEKAKLIVHSDPSGQAKDIEFMFNPSELDFTRQINWNYDVGNRGTTLLPKVNFSGVEPYSFTLQNLLFDTYETKKSVLKEYIDNIKLGVTARSDERSRPPVYILTWNDSYFHCVITSLNYQLTLFLPDGTPVKAMVNIGLQEVDPSNLPGGNPPATGSASKTLIPSSNQASKGRKSSTQNSQNLYLNKPILKLNGTPASPELMKDILEIVVDESLHMPSMFMLKIHNTEVEASENAEPWRHQKYFNIGDRISIGFEAGTTEDNDFQEIKKENRLIDAEITGIEVDFTRKSEAHIVVRGYDVSHRLYRGRYNQSFLNSTDTDIVRRVAQQARISIGKLDASGVVHEYVCQENQTHMEFLRERAAKIGFELFVQDNKVYFRKPKSDGSLKLEWLEDITSFDVRVTSAEQVSSVQVNSWDYTQKKLISETATKEQLVTETGNGNGSSTAQKFKMKQPPKMIVVDQPVETAKEAKQMAQALCNELGGEFVNADAKAVGNPEIRPGKVVELAKLGTRYSGKYYITGTCHRYVHGNYTTSFVVRGLREGSLFSTLQPKTHLQPGQTLLVGLVTKNKDPKGWGRVKVKFPTLTMDHESHWARVVGLGAANQRGFYCLPEINDEVLVGFEHGDIHRPYIVGGVWNGKDKTVETVADTVKNGKVRLRTIKTRTGHTIQFVEEDHGKSKAGIYIKTKGGHRIDINDSQKFIEIKTKGKHSIRMDDKRRSKKIEIKTSGRNKVTLNDTSKTISVKTKMGQSLTLRDLGMNVALRTTGTINVNGATAVNIGSGGAVNINAGGAVNVTAGGAANVTAGKAVNVTAGGIMNLTAAGKMSLKATNISLLGVVTYGI